MVNFASCIGKKKWIFLIITLVGLTSILFPLTWLGAVKVRDNRVHPAIVYEKPFAVDALNEVAPFCDKYAIVEKKHKTYTILSISDRPWAHTADLSCCKYNDCVMTQDHVQFSKSDAVIFSIDQFHMDNFGINDILFHKRPADQVWIFHTSTSPLSIPRPGKNHPFPFRLNAFNWSMMYRLDSEIHYPLGTLRTRSQPVTKNHYKILKEKTGLVTWVVSNCNIRHTRRIEYVKHLQRSISVDVYGKCGEMLDGPQKGRRLENNKLRETVNKYKFYLSFEDAKCKDYVSEKVYNRWNLDVVLIVRGGANYNKFLPNGTYINTDWFKSPKELATYLQWLDTSPKEYIKYLKAKEEYEGISRKETYINAMCTICRNLHYRSKYRHVYADVESWIFQNTCYPETDID